MLRLITIPISHYCEKARWALERAGIDYREERHVQGVHSSPREERLLPGDAGERAEVEALCRRLDEVLGPSGRRLMYVHMLRERDPMLTFNNAGVPGDARPRAPGRRVRAGSLQAVASARRRSGLSHGGAPAAALARA